MGDAPTWQRDPEREDRERYGDGSGRTGRTPAGAEAGTLRPPGHVPELHRALADATAGIDAVEDRLSLLFDRTADAPRPGASPPPAPLRGWGDDEIIELPDEEPVHEGSAGSAAPRHGDDEGSAAAAREAAHAAGEPEKVRRGFFRRRS
jgi:hypothetical protein